MYWDTIIQLLQSTKYNAPNVNGVAGVVMSWEGMGHPESGQKFLTRLALNPGSDEEQKVMAYLKKARRQKLPKVIKVDTQSSGSRQRAFSSTLLKKQRFFIIILVGTIFAFSARPVSAEETNPKTFDQFGFIDRNDNFKIAPHFGFCGDFLDGLSLVQTERREGCPIAGIDKDGKSIFETPERGMCKEKDFAENVIQDQKVTRPMEQSWLLNRVIDINGKKIHQVIDTSRRLIWQNPPNLCGSNAVNPTTLKFAERERFEETKVVDAKKRFLANCENYEIHPQSSTQALANVDFAGEHRYSEGLVCVDVTDDEGRARKFFIDEDGALQFELSKDLFAVGDFHEGRAPVLKRVCEQDDAGDYVEAKLGFIDRSGKLVIGCNYRTHYRYLGDTRFSEGLATVQGQDFFGVIDKSGRTIIPFKYIAMTEFHEGLCAADTLVDSAGKIYDARSNECGYQTKATFFQAYAKALEKELRALPDYGVVRFDVDEKYEQPAIARIIKGTGSKQFDQTIRDAVIKTEPPKRGEFMNYGGTMSFVLCKHHVDVAFSPSDPQYPLILERRKLWGELYTPPGPNGETYYQRLQKQIDALSATIGDERIVGVLGQSIDTEKLR